jgi:Na+-translocating ferredoxin:NAD+ oxidoreductase subunit C
MKLIGNQTFAHGIHPPEAKDDTCGLPIRQFPFAPVLVVALSQHIGRAAIATVVEGQEVVRGQCIAEPDGFLSVAMHAPATGVIRRLALAPTIVGRMMPAIYLEPYPASTQEILSGPACDLETASAEQVIAAIQRAGIVGLGGASFPTHAKLRIPADKRVDCVLINGVECEPYLTTDHRVMLEYPSDVIRGAEYLLKASAAGRVVIAVEANKPDAAEVLGAAIPPGVPISVEILPVKYPQGAEKMLISSLLQREVPSGGLPLDVGVLCFNVASTAEVGRLLPHGAGLQDRIVTVSGPVVRRKGNYRIPLGTPLRFILETVGLTDEATIVFLGGPMMGQAVSSLDIPLCKGTTGVIAFGLRETGKLAQQPQYPCIRCGYCVDACPILLNPSQLGLLAEQGNYQSMADDHHLFDCFECGCCTYVCPSHIPLVQQFRVAKTAVKRARSA